MMPKLKILPCLDSPEMSQQRRRELDVKTHIAAALGASAVESAQRGNYLNGANEKVDLGHLVQVACAKKVSIAPDATLPAFAPVEYPETTIQVTNETTLGASRRLVASGLNPLALNFANGVQPGGGFLNGARAQEEVLCRSSALYSTLVNDPMYAAHRLRPRPDSTSWAVYSPAVPVFRTDDGTSLEKPWLLSFLTCAAPYAPSIGQPESADMLQQRIHRILAIARAYGHAHLVLGAWGCGAFGNDTLRTAVDFRQALENDFRGAFASVVFAITDWSVERKFLGPFREVFS